MDRSGDPSHLRKLIARTFLQSGQPQPARMLLAAHSGRRVRPRGRLAAQPRLPPGRGQAPGVPALAESGSYRANNPLEAEPSPYLGEASCRDCHATIFRDSLSSRHTQSYYRREQLGHLPLPDRPLPDPDDPKVTHTFRKQNGALWEETQVGSEVYRAIVEYAFGTSDRYLTMVTRDADGGHLSPGCPITTRRKDAAGIARSWTRPTPSGPGSGVPGSSDRRARRRRQVPLLPHDQPAGGRSRSAPRRPTAPSAASVAMGQAATMSRPCRPASPTWRSSIPPPSPRPPSRQAMQRLPYPGQGLPHDDPDNPGWVRSQGVGWTWSRCNTESGGSFGCVTCHDPHKSARATTTAEYEARCLACHGGEAGAGPRANPPRTHGPAACRELATAPSIPTTGCVRCHMPRVRIEPLHTDLADHFIRVRRKDR